MIALILFYIDSHYFKRLAK